MHVGLQKLIPTWWQPLGGQNGLQTGTLEAGKRAILGQKNAGIGCRVGFGQQVRCRTHVETCWGFVARETLFCRLRRAFGRCVRDSSLPTTERPEPVGRLPLIRRANPPAPPARRDEPARLLKPLMWVCEICDFTLVFKVFGTLVGPKCAPEPTRPISRVPFGPFRAPFWPL